MLITQILTDQIECSTIPRLFIAESLVLALASEIYLVLLFAFAKTLLFLKVHTGFLKCFVVPFISRSTKILTENKKQKLVENNLSLI